MFQLARDLGFQQEAGAAGDVVGLLRQDLLERDLAVELAVERHADHPDTAPGVRPQGAEATAVGTRSPETRSPETRGPVGRRVGVALGAECRFGRVADRRTVVDQAGGPVQRGLDVGIPQVPQAGHQCRRRGDRGQAPLGIAAVLLEMAPHQALQNGAILRREPPRSTRI